MQVDSSKVINKLLNRIAELEKDRAILLVKIDELTGLNEKIDEIERGNAK